MPAPEVAVNYYTGGDLYLFGKFFNLIFFRNGCLPDDKNWNFTLACSFPQMNFKLPGFQILDGLK